MNGKGPGLKRTVTFPLLVLYGVGTMVGGGFYALLGEITGEAGLAAPLAFLLSGVLAALTGCSFAELASRYPVSAGEARYVREGLGYEVLSTLVGWLVIATGVVSAATLAVATIGFLRDVWPLVPGDLGIVVLVLLMGGIAAWGIDQSVAVVCGIAVIEVAALLYALGLNAGALAALPARWPEVLAVANGNPGAWIGVISAAFLAFYAFIGFEDMVNMAEEVKRVHWALPLAILVSIALSTLLYVVVSTAAVLALPIEDLSSSATPIAELVRGGGRMATTGAWLVSLLAGVNGALVQIIMASRVVFGMAGRGQAPALLSRVSSRTRTPVRATALITAVVLLLSVFFPLTMLARFTSGIILVVFALANLALWRIKGIVPDEGGLGPRFPRWVPLLGSIASALILSFQVWLSLAGAE